AWDGLTGAAKRAYRDENCLRRHQGLGGTAMSKTRLGLVIAGLLAPALSFAETPAAAPQGALDEIIVTATKRAESAQSV
ncbi:hypothetical protein C1Y06_30875, partial [Pseudomonas sp. FW306-02-H06C]